MEIGTCQLLASWLLALLTMVQPLPANEIFKITRHNNSDIFAYAQGTKEKTCTEDTCIVISSGTAQAISKKDFCTCRCHPQLPTFREDLSICVDDIRECVLAPFVDTSTSAQIPFVFLPLKDQIIYPDKEISLTGIKNPVCAISGAKYLTEAGWSDLRSPINSDVPLRLYTDQSRTFLKWVGDKDLRSKMSGRIILVQLMCRQLGDNLSGGQDIFTPCVAFRTVGTPAKIPSNVTEVTFLPEPNLESQSSDEDTLSVSEYVAIGMCSVLLGLIYVASIFLYLHLKKRNTLKRAADRKESIANVEEGIIKNNPLLSLNHHFGPPESTYSDTNSSDNENTPDLIQNHESHITSAIVHTHQKNRQRPSSPGESYQDSSSFEKLPEENVSIVETLDDRIDGLKAMNGTIRKKLYFNPAYFEPHLLVAPPPAALEFLAKIREVIAIAKQKMSSKRYVPSLLIIPEEESVHSVEPSCDFSRPSSKRGSCISLKRENSRRKYCCAECEVQPRSKLPPEKGLPVLVACHNCCANLESKQHSIQKWLEDIPMLQSVMDHESSKSPRRVRSPARSLPPESISSERALSPRPSSEKGVVEASRTRNQTRNPLKKKKQKEKKIHKPTSPPPPAPIKAMLQENYYETLPADVKKNLPPPDMIQEAIEMENQAEETRIPTLTKRQMNAVINELTVHKNMLEAANRELARRASAGYDTDSLERNTKNKGYSTPSDYADISSSQVSPSLSAALPVDEEITMQNAIFNTLTGNMTLSKLNSSEDEHEYELLILKNNKFGCGYSLVSEVYVNNGYNFSSNPSSRSNSNCSTLEKKSLKIRYDGGAEKPGKLLIEVEDCLDHYIPVNDSDEFEPDTLDRPNKSGEKPSTEPPQNSILLKTTGSFKNLDINCNSLETSNFNRVFGSLRELYEEKRKLAKEQESYSLTELEGKLLTLEDRHSKRQRVKTTSQGPAVPPDLIPPPPHDDSVIYEQPKPPRVVTNSKNLLDRSVSKPQVNDTPKKNIRKWCNLRPEDSGYLSTDSNEHLEKKCPSEANGSETDESLGDAHSESGAESVETHSVFFGRFSRKAVYSALGDSKMILSCNDVHSSSDSETVSYTTVVPVSPTNNNSLVMR